jgi:hypothetical protein
VSQNINFSRFIDLFDIEPTEFGEARDGCFDWYADLRICPSGVYLATCPFGAGLTREERAALPQHPTGNYAEPILAFPATLRQVIELLDEHGLIDCVDDRALAELDADPVAQDEPDIPPADEAAMKERRLSDIQRERAIKGHHKPGGAHEKRDAIRAIWASGKYDTRDRCAEEECAAFGLSFATARRHLRNTPEPSRLAAAGTA